jgi:hypothetical protein
MILGIIATIFIIGGRITESQFGIVIMATVISYIVSKTIDKKFSESKTTYAKIIDRIESLFSREFIMSLIAVIAISYLCYAKYIGSDLWMQVVFAVGSVYNIFNSVEKAGN